MQADRTSSRLHTYPYAEMVQPGPFVGSIVLHLKCNAGIQSLFQRMLTIGEPVTIQSQRGVDFTNAEFPIIVEDVQVVNKASSDLHMAS